MSVPEDVQRLMEQFPGWSFGTVWASANSGPDQRRLWAVRDGIALSSWDAAELASQIRKETGQ